MAKGNMPLHSSGEKDAADVPEVLITNRMDVNAAKKVGYVPLHCASARGHAAMVELLLTRGADINARGNNGLELTSLPVLC